MGSPPRGSYSPDQRFSLISASLLVAAGQGALPAFFAAAAAAAGTAFAAIALSVADGAAPPAACGLHRHFVLRVAGVRAPAAAEVFADLSLAAQTAFLAPSRISGSASDCPCLGDRAVQ